ncbi:MULTISPECIES: hypothetical protein [Bradyrhizobium]|uniref:hypothetical protein n=1 Tax=Bradyrhizobium TaxID=374 RepID=UPI0003F9A6E2|nr:MULTISPECIES: hypothetical protein [Bradyrhizobium]QOG16352.1 hypothetical protein FOM02_02340 [Bradyrhizobium sp. SEMIA]UFW49020.1 hypothetical protein BaraCB756_43485 [Bradyrhizobium arachidis]
MKKFDNRTKANLDVVLEEVCRGLPHGGDHELRRRIADRMLESAVAGNTTLAGLAEVAKAALAEATKRSA